MTTSASCTCPERHIWVNGKGPQQGVKLAPQVHDCDYVKRRTALIPEAEKMATDTAWELVKIIPEGETIRDHPTWSREFMRAMDRLWARERAREYEREWAVDN